ncbi:hypothetical protein IAR50_002598 [Cryptococcus sp. DSM 104548]
MFPINNEVAQYLNNVLLHEDQELKSQVASLEEDIKAAKEKQTKKKLDRKDSAGEGLLERRYRGLKRKVDRLLNGEVGLPMRVSAAQAPTGKEKKARASLPNHLYQERSSFPTIDTKPTAKRRGKTMPAGSSTRAYIGHLRLPS